MNVTLRICLLLLTIAQSLHAQIPNDSTRVRRWFVPHYIPVQFAGNVGLLSTGVGFSSKKLNYDLAILYGYVPRSVAGTYIHTLAAKNYFPVGRYPVKSNQTVIPYLGLGVSLEVGGNSFFTMPVGYPDGYYNFPKNLHLLLYGGVRLENLFDQINWLRGIQFYAEGGTVDVYLWYKTMSSTIQFQHIFSLSFGLNFLLER